MDLLRATLAQTADKCALTPDDIDALCHQIQTEARNAQCAKRYLPEVHQLIRMAPHLAAPQILYIRLHEILGETDHMLDTSSGLHQRFPQNPTALLLRVWWLFERGRDDIAYGVLNNALITASAVTDLVAVVTALIDRRPGDCRLRMLLAQCHFAQGDLCAAFDMADPLRDADLMPSESRFIARLEVAITTMESITPGSSLSSEIAPQALANVITRLPGGKTPTVIGRRIDGIAFFCPDLGVAAQADALAQFAGVVERYQGAGKNLHGYQIVGDVRIITGQGASDQSRLMAEISAGDVGIDVISAPAPPAECPISDMPELALLWPLLPRDTRQWLSPLLTHLREHPSQILCLSGLASVGIAGLAGLLANVPRIVVFADTEPVEDGVAALHQSFAARGEVGYCAGSRADAERLAFLCDQPDIPVLPPVISPKQMIVAQDQESRWNGFDTLTPDALLTVGVFLPQETDAMLDDWIAGLAALDDQFPNIRFLAFGAGMIDASIRARFAQAGLTRQVFFASNNAMRDYWFAKMDFFIALTETPPIKRIIEAQLSGLPGIATPAAADIISDGRTGFIIADNAATQLSDEIGAAVTRLLTGQPGLARLGTQARKRATRRFEANAAAQIVLAFLCGAPFAPDAPKITEFPTKKTQNTFDPARGSEYKMV